MRNRFYEGSHRPVTRGHSQHASLLDSVERTWQRRRRVRSTILKLAAAGAVVALFVVAENCRADDRRTCFAVTPTSTNIVVSGNVLRLAALAATMSTLGGDSALAATTAPSDPVRCTGVNTSIPAAGPTATNYYGAVTNKAKFRRFSQLACNNVGPVDQYFSMGKAIYYRNCHTGAGINYIYFWGKQDGNASTCFGSTYPEMYAIANSTSNPVTATRMATVYNNTGLTEDTQAGYALGNMMAAALIAESARDFLVIPENYMLMDRLAAGKITALQLIGGHCVGGAETCGNTAATQDGAHPLAWGGAQASMMTGGWGTSNGATSDFGMAFETDLIVNWLKDKNKIATTTASCPVTTLGGYGGQQQTTIRGLFTSLF